MVLGFCQLPQDPPEPPPEPEPQTIAEIAAGNEDLSTLVTALGLASDAGPIDFLAAVSDPHADLTVFAPTNDAFAALGDTLDAALADPGGLLTDVLAYHVLGESLTGEELVHAGSATTLGGADVTVEVRDGNVFINDAQVIIADVQASNGIVHVIDAVLLPPAPEPEPQTIAEIAAGNEDLSTLVTALTVASENGPIDFLAAVSDPHADLTVFAPTNDAFAALGDTLDAALADPGGLLTDVLAYHVLGESLTGEELVHAGSATTLGGADVTVEVRDGNVFINDAQVIIADVQASNGIVHVIDAVLLPPAPEPEPQTIAEIAAGNEDLSTLVTALTVASENGPIDFLAAVSDPHADLTVFAPTNDAFAALGDTLDAALADPGGLLTDVLAYHVLGESLTGEELVHAGSATTLGGADVTVEVRDGNVFINDAQVIIADVQASNGIVHVIDAVLLPPAPTV